MCAIPDREPIEDDPRASDNPRYDVRSPDTWVGAVLLADEIKHYCEVEPPMIEPFEPERLRPASYQLTLGEEIHLGGVPNKLDRYQPTMLPPHQEVVVTTEQVLRIPRFLIARWSIRVKTIYEGLLWTGGLQVDPGWYGQLHCPVYNLSDRPVELRRGDEFFTIDFIRTTALSNEYDRIRSVHPKVWFSARPRTIGEDDIHRIHSAPRAFSEEVERMRTEMEEVRHEYAQYRAWVVPIVGIMFVVIAAVVTALGVVAIRPVVNLDEPLLSGWPLTAVASGLFAAVLSIFSTALTILVVVRRIGVGTESASQLSAGSGSEAEDDRGKGEV